MVDSLANVQHALCSMNENLNWLADCHCYSGWQQPSDACNIHHCQITEIRMSLCLRGSRSYMLLFIWQPHWNQLQWDNMATFGLLSKLTISCVWKLSSGEGNVMLSGYLEPRTPSITKHTSATVHWEKVMNRGVPNYSWVHGRRERNVVRHMC